jgi:hypothetical protein
MHLPDPHIRLVAAAAAIVLGASAPGAATAANEAADGDSASPAIVLAELGRGDQQFIPGVTDSGTGVLRELERTRGERPTPVASGSGFDLAGDDGVLALGAGLLAVGVAASLALGAAERRRRLAA